MKHAYLIPTLAGIFYIVLAVAALVEGVEGATGNVFVMSILLGGIGFLWIGISIFLID